MGMIEPFTRPQETDTVEYFGQPAGALAADGEDGVTNSTRRAG